MIRLILLASLFFLVHSVYSKLEAQEKIAPDVYLIRFTDKNQSAFLLNDPSKFLSDRALQRRKNQNISLKENDLPVSNIYLDSLQKLGFTVLNTSKWLNAVSVQVTDTSVFQKLSGISFVKPYSAKTFSAIRYVKRAKEEVVSRNVLKAGSDFYGSSYSQIAIHHGDYLHNMGFRGQGMLIAVLDGGFNNANHMPVFDSLWLQNRVVLTRDTYKPNTDLYALDWHGSMVLSTMAGTQSGKLVGTAPMASYMLIRSENSTTWNGMQYEFPIEEFNWAVAAELADSTGADVITSSLGYSLFDDTTMNLTYRDMNGKTSPASIAATVAAAEGMIVLVSAGNEGNNSWKYITAPADADSILTVGAININGVRASFSSVGPTFDRRIKPDVMAVGWGAAVQEPDSVYALANGTSFSSPIMAGLTACLWQSSPTSTNMEIINAIKQSASQYNNPDSLMGYGIPDFQKAYESLNPTGIKESREMATYPFYVTSDFNVRFGPLTESKAILQVFDANGQKLIDKQIDVNTSAPNVIAVSEFASFASGMYIVRIITPSKALVCKALKL